MRIEALATDRIDDFVMYCKKHRYEIDDSFLYDEDLKEFKPGDENPTFIITDNKGEIRGTASLILDEYNRRGRKARFRIFHSEIEDAECYKMLMNSILKHTEGLDKIFVFVPVVNKILTEFIEELKFIVDRYSFLLVREDLEVPEFSFPEGYKVKPLELGYDEEAWCTVRNAAFATLQGSETPITPDMVIKMVSGEDNIEGGSMLLFHGEKPVGVIRAAKDEYENSPIMNIGPVAIIPEYQGKGLGRMLLRSALRFSREQSYKRAVLCVNAENERAKSLYIQEGFRQVEAVVCYKYPLGK